ncbi:MAG: type II toxin-antitoxin system VapC family toxin [Candidatus Methylumidiphilus sp.]
MIAIDTNVLVRVIVEDTGQPEQTLKARALVSDAQRVYVTQIVQVELTWVLAKVYKTSKLDLLSVLQHLLNNPGYVLQHRDRFAAALNIFRHSPADFADCLILSESQQAQAILHTFDKRLAKHGDTAYCESINWVANHRQPNASRN